MEQKKRSNAIKNYELLTRAYGSNYEAVSKNNNHFETKVTYISSGVIVLSFAFINGVNIAYGYFFIVGNILAALSLIINLASYFWK